MVHEFYHLSSSAEKGFEYFRLEIYVHFDFVISVFVYSISLLNLLLEMAGRIISEKFANDLLLSREIKLIKNNTYSNATL